MRVMIVFSQKIYSLGLYELFRWVCMWDLNDVNVSPGSSTSPTSDPGRETVFTGVPQFQGPPTGSSNRVARVFE